MKSKFLTKLYQITVNPSRIPSVFKNSVNRFYKYYIKRDEFTLSIVRWEKDNVESTLRFDYSLNKNSIVFDLGGYKGDFAYEIFKKFECNIYIFEPVNDFYDFCVERFYGNEKIKCFKYGFSGEDNKIFIAKKNDKSSIVYNSNCNLNEEICVKVLSDEFQNFNISFIDLLKINVEGAEFLILQDIISSGLIKNINYLQIQFHDFYPDAQNLRLLIRDKLSETHREMWDYPFVWESWELKK